MVEQLRTYFLKVVIMSFLKKIHRYVFDSDYRFFVNSNHGCYMNMNDKKYLTKRYKAILGKTMNIESPKTFNEKLQWLKVNDRKDYYTLMVDKYEAKKYIQNHVKNIKVIKTIGIYNSFDDIDFNLLRNKFVLKCTHDS